MMPCLVKHGMQGGAVGIKKALLGSFLGIAGVEKTEVSDREHRAERNIVDACGISAAALQNHECAAAQRVAIPGLRSD